MFRFEHIDHLYLLIAIPVLLVCFILAWQWRKKRVSEFADAHLLEQLTPGLSKYKDKVKFGVLLLALAVLTIGWANPQWGSKKEKVMVKSVDVFIALDISDSMLAEDVPPSRMERSRKFAQDLIDKMKGDRIGLILFAGDAYLQVPLTHDYSYLKNMLRSASPKLAGSQGTAIGESVNMAINSYPEEEDGAHKALVVITDGENHEGQADEAVQRAQEEGVLTFTVGVGTSEGAFIPIQIGQRTQFKRDKSGNPVKTSLNENMLRSLANTGGGNYFNLRNGDQVLSALRTKIDKLEKREVEQRSFTDFESYFQYFIAAGLFLLIIEFLISFRQSTWLKGKDIY